MKKKLVNTEVVIDQMQDGYAIIGHIGCNALYKYSIVDEYGSVIEEFDITALKMSDKGDPYIDIDGQKVNNVHKICEEKRREYRENKTETV